MSIPLKEKKNHAVMYGVVRRWFLKNWLRAVQS